MFRHLLLTLTRLQGCGFMSDVDQPCDIVFCCFALLQDLYVALPVPEPLRSGENAGSFAFLEKELRISQM
jgi:hypothetical protein